MILVRLLSPSAIGTVALLFSVPGTNLEGGGTSTPEACFRCNEEFNQQGQSMEHWDAYFAFEGDRFQGNFHSQNWSSCIGAISVAGHILYGSPEQDEEDALDRAVAGGSNAQLLAIITTSRNVEVNLQRSAIQVIDEKTNQVMYHAKVPRSQAERLTMALATDGNVRQFTPRQQ